MTSPVSYILVSLTLTSAIIAVTFFIAWRTLGEKQYALSWCLAMVAATVQWFCNLQMYSFRDFASYWLTVGALAVVVMTLGLKGHAQRTESTWLPRNLWPFAIIVYLALIWITLGWQHVGLANAFLPGVSAATLFISAAMIVHHREKTRPAEWGAAAMITLVGVVQLAAAAIAFQQGPGGDQVYRDLYMHFNFMTLPAGYTGMAIFILFMMASDLSAEMKELAVRDQLTGLLNRRGFGEQGATAYSFSRRTGRFVSIVMTDIDRFKEINDEFGHAAGDAALCHFAKLLKADRRAEDVVARVGGEEFAIVLPGANLERALDIAEKLCKQLEKSPLLVDGKPLAMTASFGVATISARDKSLSDIVVRADRALYRSKRAGRNRVDLESSQRMRLPDPAPEAAGS